VPPVYISLRSRAGRFHGAKRKEVDLMSDEEKGPEPKETPEPETFPREYVEDLRRENAARRTKEKDLAKKVEDLEKKQQEAEDKDKSEVERLSTEKTRLEKEMEDLRRENATSTVRSEVRIQAARMGFNNPDDAYRLLDLAKIDPEELGKDAEKALKALAKDKPYLIKSEKPIPPTPGHGGKPVEGKPNQTFAGAILKSTQKP
jgi:hypothetical protein